MIKFDSKFFFLNYKNKLYFEIENLLNYIWKLTIFWNFNYMFFNIESDGDAV